ncbi:MAG: GtrA family protein [bacterium]|nr:GtrA family protein [bacterium]
MIKKMYDKYQEIIMYLVFGVLTTVISLAVYYLLTFTLIDANNAFWLQVANIVSWIAGVLFAYVTNRKFVFKSSNINKGREFFSFVGARVTTLILDMVIMGVGVSILKGNDKILKIISQVLVIVGNYVLSKLFVFKKKEGIK